MHCPVYNIVMIFKVEMFMRFSTRKKHIYIYIFPTRVLLIVIQFCESSILEQKLEMPISPLLGSIWRLFSCWTLSAFLLP